MTLLSCPSSIKATVSILYVDGPLHRPTGCDVRHRVKALLRRGERRIVLDLSQVPKIDAAGIGELVRVYNMARAVDATVQVANADAWVRGVIERVGLGGLLLPRARVALSRGN
jgi:anti-anti-sigma factor